MRSSGHTKGAGKTQKKLLEECAYNNLPDFLLTNAINAWSGDHSDELFKQFLLEILKTDLSQIPNPLPSNHPFRLFDSSAASEAILTVTTGMFGPHARDDQNLTYVIAMTINAARLHRLKQSQQADALEEQITKIAEAILQTKEVSVLLKRLYSETQPKGHQRLSFTKNQGAELVKKVVADPRSQIPFNLTGMLSCSDGERTLEHLLNEGQLQNISSTDLVKLDFKTLLSFPANTRQIIELILEGVVMSAHLHSRLLFAGISVDTRKLTIEESMLLPRVQSRSQRKQLTEYWGNYTTLGNQEVLLWYFSHFQE